METKLLFSKLEGILLDKQDFRSDKDLIELAKLVLEFFNEKQIQDYISPHKFYYDYLYDPHIDKPSNESIIWTMEKYARIRLMQTLKNQYDGTTKTDARRVSEK